MSDPTPYGSHRPTLPPRNSLESILGALASMSSAVSQLSIDFGDQTLELTRFHGFQSQTTPASSRRCGSQDYTRLTWRYRSPGPSVSVRRPAQRPGGGLARLHSGKKLLSGIFSEIFKRNQSRIFLGLFLGILSEKSWVIFQAEFISATTGKTPAGFFLAIQNPGFSGFTWREFSGGKTSLLSVLCINIYILIIYIPLGIYNLYLYVNML